MNYAKSSREVAAQQDRAGIFSVDVRLLEVVCISCGVLLCVGDLISVHRCIVQRSREVQGVVKLG